MSVRLAHLFPASPFLRFTAHTFELAMPGMNTFLVHGAGGDLARYALPAGVAAESIVRDAEGMKRVNSVIRDSDIAIFHSVSTFAARALIAAPADTLTVWSGWGGDYYGTDWSMTAGLLGPITDRYERQRRNIAGKIVQPLSRRRQALVLHRAARATDVFSAPVPDDLAVFRRRFPGFVGRYAQLNYASVEDTYAVGAEAASGHDILLGNSASTSNNHLDVLELLAQTDIEGRRIITPLSYGDRVYADTVTARGRELFGDAFVPLRDFLPLDQYQALIAGCSTVVMGHHRQQAVGNIASALWTGARVVLHDSSPVLSFLESRGAHVEPLSVVPAGLKRNRVSPQELEDNRRVLREFWGRDRVIANIRELVDSV